MSASGSGSVVLAGIITFLSIGFFVHYKNQMEKDQTFTSTEDNKPAIEKIKRCDKAAFKEMTCLICLEKLSTDETVQFQCLHLFHVHCIKELLKVKNTSILETCPHCRQWVGKSFANRLKITDPTLLVLGCLSWSFQAESIATTGEDESYDNEFKFMTEVSDLLKETKRTRKKYYNSFQTLLKDHIKFEEEERFSLSSIDEMLEAEKRYTSGMIAFILLHTPKRKRTSFRPFIERHINDHIFTVTDRKPIYF